MDQRHPILIEEYYLYVLWFACPTRYRAIYNLPLTQKEFAQKHNVTERTLINWRDYPNWAEDLRRVRKKWLAEHTSDILESMVIEAKSGNVLAAKWILELAEDYIPEKTGFTKVPDGAVTRITGEAYLDEDGNTLMSKQTQEFIKQHMNGNSSSPEKSITDSA